MAYLDKYGTTHNTQQQMAFANLCYDMMHWLTFDQGLLVQDAEKLISEMIDNSPEGQVARDRFQAFISLTEHHHKGNRRGKKD